MGELAELHHHPHIDMSIITNIHHQNVDLTASGAIAGVFRKWMGNADTAMSIQIITRPY